MDKLFRRSKSQNDLENAQESWETLPGLEKKKPETSRSMIPSSEKRVRLVGELLQLMESGKASSASDVDAKLSSCFQEYLTCATPALHPDVEHLFLTSHTKTKPITPPKCLKKSNNVSSLERYSKLERVFRSVPMFDNKDINVRDFLQEMSNVVSDLGCDVTEAEFKYILLNKIASKIKAILTASQSSATLSSIYDHLQNLYDNTSSERDVFSSLVSGKQNFQSLKEYLEYTLRLLSNIRSTKESSQALIHNLKLYLPPRIYDRIVEYSDKYESLKKETPPVEKIVSILYTNREAIDKHFQSKNTHKYNELKIDMQQESCSICHKRGHSEAQCYRRSVCPICNKVGHTPNYCKQNKPICQKCGRTGHLTAECRARCRLCNAMTHNAVQCPIYTNIEPAQIHCAKCFDNVALKLFHPTSSCRNFGNPKNGY